MNFTCGSYLKDEIKSTDLKCVENSQCGKPVKGQDNTIIDCQGFYGDPCTSDEECDYNLGMRCLSIYQGDKHKDRPLYNDTAYCAPKELCKDHRDDDGEKACYGDGGGRGYACKMDPNNNTCDDGFVCSNFQQQSRFGGYVNVSSLCVEEKMCRTSLMYYGRYTTIMCSATKSIMASSTVALAGLITYLMI